MARRNRLAALERDRAALEAARQREPARTDVESADELDRRIADRETAEQFRAEAQRERLRLWAARRSRNRSIAIALAGIGLVAVAAATVAAGLLLT